MCPRRRPPRSIVAAQAPQQRRPPSPPRFCRLVAVSPLHDQGRGPHRRRRLRHRRPSPEDARQGECLRLKRRFAPMAGGTSVHQPDRSHRLDQSSLVLRNWMRTRSRRPNRSRQAGRMCVPRRVDRLGRPDGPISGPDRDPILGPMWLLLEVAHRPGPRAPLPLGLQRAPRPRLRIGTRRPRHRPSQRRALRAISTSTSVTGSETTTRRDRLAW
jgi:hypothetical protein